MNKIILVKAILLNICMFTSAQTKAKKSMSTELDSTAVFLLNRISQHTAPYYKLYKTENMWTFLELETFSGRIWQVQYSVDSETSTRMKTILNIRNLAENEEEEFAAILEEKTNNDIAAEQKRLKASIAASDARLKEIERLYERVYEDNVNGKVTDDWFMKLTRMK